MKYPILLATLIVSLFLGQHLAASPLNDKIEAFKKALKDEIAAHPGKELTKPLAAAFDDPDDVVASLDTFAQAVNDPNALHNVEIEISQILDFYTSDTVQKTGHELTEELRTERKNHIDATESEMQALLKRVSETVANAKKTDELDGLISDLQKFLGNRGYNAENQGLYQQVSSAFEFTKAWQNYLSHETTGQHQLALTDLQSINQANYAVGVIPRSQILDRITAATAAKSAPGSTEPSAEVTAILKGISTLDDMEPALQKLAQLTQSDPQNAKAYNNLSPFVQLYDSVKTGLPETINFNFVGTSNATTLSPKLQAQLLNFVLQHYFDSYKGAAPGADEKPEAYVNRVIVDAVAQENWPLLRKAFNGQTYLNRNSALAMSTANNTSAGVDSLLAAVNQETAGQFAMAVISYQNALKVADTTIPAKWIGDKLAAIKKDHPKEYEDGMQAAMSAGTTRNFSNPMMMFGRPTRMLPPGTPANGSVATPALSVPTPANQPPPPTK